MYGMGNKLMGVQPDAGQSTGNFNNGMMQGMGNATGGLANSIGPSQNFMQKFAPPGANGINRFLSRGLPGLPGSKSIGRALGGIFGFGRKKKPMMMPQQGMAMGAPMQDMPAGTPDMSQGMPEMAQGMGQEMPQAMPEMPMGADGGQATEAPAQSSIGPSMGVNSMISGMKKKKRGFGSFFGFG